MFSMGHIFSSYSFPNFISCVLSTFIFRPDMDSKLVSVSIDLHIEPSDPSNVKNVSSAYCPILISDIPSFMPITFGSCFNSCASGSIANINIYGDHGYPCLQPLPSSKNSK